MSTAGPYIDTTSGRRVYFLKPKPSQIDIEDIAEGLSKICRFYGHCTWYSVAEHSVRVSWILPPDLQLVGLMHDAQEAIVGDMHSGLKQLIPQYKAIERRMEEVIARKYRLPFPHPPGVKVADLTLLTTEKRDLKRHSDWRDSPYTPLPDRIVPWSPEKARKEFLKRFESLT